MSGLAGALSADTTISNAWLPHAAALMSHGSSFGTVQWRDGVLGLAYASVRPAVDQLAAAQCGPVTLFITGETYNVADLHARFSGGANSSAGAADRARGLAELYLAHGLRPLTQLNGAFLVGIWDIRDQTLHLMTDRFGFCKLYYAQTPAGFWFASEVKALLAHAGVSRSVDEEALTQFLSFGHVLDDRTLYPSIRLLQGGGVLSYGVNQGVAHIASYWTMRYATAGNGLSLAECADELARRLTTAVERQIRGASRIGIPLSGGLDSRTLLGFAQRSRAPEAIQTFTVGHRHTYDVVFGRRLARVSGVPHQFIPLEPDFMARRAARFAWLTDGMVNAHHCWQMGALEHRRGSWDHMLSGYLGGPLTAYHPNIQAAIGSATPDGMEDVFLRTFNNVFVEEELKSLLRPEIYGTVRGAALDDMRRTFRQACVDELVDRTRVALMRHDQQRCIWYLFAVYGTASSVSAPFADNDVMDFLLTVPVRYRCDRLIQKEMLRRHLPALARVATDKTGLALNASPERYRWHRRWRRLVTEQLPRWTGGRYRWHDRRLYAHYDEWMRLPLMQAYLRETFRRAGHHLAEWCEPAQVQRLLEEQLTGQANRHRQISALLTLVLWFEQAEQIRPVTVQAGG